MIIIIIENLLSFYMIIMKQSFGLQLVYLQHMFQQLIYYCSESFTMKTITSCSNSDDGLCVMYKAVFLCTNLVSRDTD